MTADNRYGRYYRFLAWLVVVVLVNVAGTTLFFRVDMTADNIYSLSEASREVVGNLSEPLNIYVFFTEDLPAPHNNTERYLRDLLEEYAVHSNRFFNYRFYDVSAEEGDIGEDERRNQELARDYGISPVQVQNIEQDEVQFQRAYMGLVMLHGDVVEKVPAITSTEGLEYEITSKIEKMNNKISALIGLEDPVDVTLMFSPSLIDVAPHVRMEGISDIPSRVEKIVAELQDKYYGKLDYSAIDPAADSLTAAKYSKYNLVTLRWRSIADRAGNEVVPPGRGTAAVVVEKGDRFRTIPLIEVFNVPLFGTQYQMADLGTLGEKVGEAVDDVIDINKKIGYLTSHGTLPLRGGGQVPGQPQPPQQEAGLNNFSRMVSENYSIEEIGLKGGGGIPEGIDCLIIAGPRERFDEWELYQIDQFLMKGKALALFMDSYEEMQMPAGQRNPAQGPMYVPVETGLDRLLGTWGVTIDRSYVLDKNCFEQQMPRMYGGGKQSIYFAPVIKDENINHDLAFMKHIKALVTVMNSPVRLLGDTMESAGLTGDVVFTSSEESWEMSGRIDFSPWSMQPPDDPEEMEKYPLTAIVRGEFPSAFAETGMPEMPSEEPDTAAAEDGGEPGEAGMEMLSGEGALIERGRPGRLFVAGSSEVLKDNIIDEEGASTSSTYIMNVLDHLNGRDAYAAMRGRTQRFNPLRETGPGVKTFVKTFNIAGLPVVVIVFGIIVWARRTARKRRIEALFRK